MFHLFQLNLKFQLNQMYPMYHYYRRMFHLVQTNLKYQLYQMNQMNHLFHYFR